MIGKLVNRREIYKYYTIGPKEFLEIYHVVNKSNSFELKTKEYDCGFSIKK